MPRNTNAHNHTRTAEPGFLQGKRRQGREGSKHVRGQKRERVDAEGEQQERRQALEGIWHRERGMRSETQYM